MVLFIYVNDEYFGGSNEVILLINCIKYSSKLV